MTTDPISLSVLVGSRDCPLVDVEETCAVRTAFNVVVSLVVHAKEGQVLMSLLNPPAAFARCSSAYISYHQPRG